MLCHTAPRGPALVGPKSAPHFAPLCGAGALSSARYTKVTQTKVQYLARAAKARAQAEHATTATARAIHLEIAQDYEAKAAAVEGDAAK